MLKDKYILLLSSCASLAFSSLAAEVLVGPVRESVCGGSFYEIQMEAELTTEQATDVWAVGACFVRFFAEGRRLRADETLLPAAPKRDPFNALEFLFPDTAQKLENGRYRWFIQVRPPDAATEMAVEVRPWGKNGNVRFEKNIKIRSVPSGDIFVPAGGKLRRKVKIEQLERFLVVKGSAKAVSSGEFHDLKIEVEPWFNTECKEIPLNTCMAKCDSNGNFCARIELPMGMNGGIVSLSAVGRQSFLLRGLKIYGDGQSMALPVKELPLEYDLKVVEGDVVHIMAKTMSSLGQPADRRGALCRFDFTDAAGKCVECPELPSSQKYGAYKYMPLRAGESVFRCQVIVPRSAISLKLKLSRFTATNVVQLTAFEASSTVPVFKSRIRKDDWREMVDAVEGWVGKAGVAAIRERQNPTNLYFSLCDTTMGRGNRGSESPNQICLTPFPSAEISPDMDWTLNPFDNLGWQLSFDSCYWIPFAGASLTEGDYYRHCRNYWQSFQRYNQYPSRANKMSFNDHTCAARIEAALLTMYGNNPQKCCQLKVSSLMRRLREDDEFFYRLMYQLFVDVSLVDYYLRSETYKVHNHNLLMARALLSFADCFSAIPFAERYRNLSLNVILDHYRRIFEPDGFIREQSTKYHHWMIGYFAEFIQYAWTHNLFDEPRLRELGRSFVPKLTVGIGLLGEDGWSIPMGDGDREAALTVLKKHAECLARLDPENFSAVIAWKPPPRISLPESGIYCYRHAASQSVMLIDLSETLKEHGHHDCGSWQFQSQGIRWISDLGGPYKYSTRDCRILNSSSSHTLVEPLHRRQTSGQAFSVQETEDADGWALKGDSNVYGPDYLHHIQYRVSRDLTFASIETSFQGPCAAEYVGRIMLGPGVSARRAAEGGNRWVLEKDGKSILISISGTAASWSGIVDRNASWQMNVSTPVKCIEYRMRSDSAIDSIVEIYDYRIK